MWVIRTALVNNKVVGYQVGYWVGEEWHTLPDYTFEPSRLSDAEHRCHYLNGGN